MATAPRQKTFRIKPGERDAEDAMPALEGDAVAQAMATDDPAAEDADEDDATLALTRMRPLYPPGQYPISESLCDCWYRCWSCCKALWVSKCCWRFTFRCAVEWCAKESRYIAQSPRIVHAFVVNSFLIILLAIITGATGGTAANFLLEIPTTLACLDLPCCSSHGALPAA